MAGILDRLREKKALNRFLRNEGVDEGLEDLGIDKKGLKSLDELNSSIDAKLKIQKALNIPFESRTKKLERQSKEAAEAKGVVERTQDRISGALDPIREKIAPVRDRISGALDPAREALGLTTKAERPEPLAPDLTPQEAGSQLEQDAEIARNEAFQRTGVPRVDNARAIQERDLDLRLLEDKEKAIIAIEKGTEERLTKEEDQALGDVLNLRLKTQNSIDSFMDLAELAVTDAGLSPGVAAGIWSTVTGKLALNEFFPGFEGGRIEFGAAAGRVAMNSARAVRLIGIFQKTGLDSFMSTEQAARTAADSWRNGMSRHFSNQLREEAKGLDLTTQKGRIELTRQIKNVDDALREMEASYSDSILVGAHKRNPKLLRKGTIQKIKVRWANQIANENPELSREEVIDRVERIIKGDIDGGQQ